MFESRENILETGKKPQKGLRMEVPLLDLKTQYLAIKEEIEAAVREVFDSQRFIGGPAVKACEEALEKYCACAHAVGVSSGTDALLIALMAEGIGPGDEVVTTPYTFFATAGGVARLGARPVFADIDPVTFNIDPAGIEEKITERTRAIIPVDLFGQVAEMDAILAIAERRDLVVIEDAAQAIGAEHNGRRAGSTADYGCFSFYPSKNLGGAGDGGAVITKDSGRAERLRKLRSHGAFPKYYHEMVGGNFRLDALQAAVVRVKMRYLDGWTRARQANVERYGRLFRGSALLDKGTIRLPEIKTDRHIFNQYVIRAERRDALKDYLSKRKIGVEIYYPCPLHLQKCFAYLGFGQGDFPESERAAGETLALPVYPEVSDEQARYVADCISAFYAQ